MLAHRDPAASEARGVTPDGIRSSTKRRTRSDSDTAQPANFFFSSSLSSAGLALPPVAFMTCPTKKPNSLSLPER